MNTRNTRTWKAVSVLVALTMLISAGLFLGPAPVALANTTVTFYATDMDSYVRQDNAGTSYGNEDYLYVRSYRQGSTNRNRRTYVRFDLSSLPADAEIVSATLRLNLTGAPGASRTYDVYRVTAGWAENTITMERHQRRPGLLCRDIQQLWLDDQGSSRKQQPRSSRNFLLQRKWYRSPARRHL